jgi:uncharacterized membrane protein
VILSHKSGVAESKYHFLRGGLHLPLKKISAPNRKAMILLCCAIAYTILMTTLISHHGKDSTLAIAMCKDWKGKLSILIYFMAVLTAVMKPAIACALYVLVAIMWLIPDRRIERHLKN